MGHSAEDYVAGYRDSWDREQDRKREEAEKKRSTPKQCDNYGEREHSAHLWYGSGYRTGSAAAPPDQRPVYWCRGIHPETEKWKGRIVEFHQDGTVTWRKASHVEPVQAP